MIIKLINAVDYGVPQKRERVLIVGTEKGLIYNFPKKEDYIVTLREALKDVPPSEGMQYSANRKKVLELVPPGGCWRDLPIEIQKSFMGKRRYSGGGRTGMARRMSQDEPSLTLTASPSQKQTERCHPEETRPFTIREYARIQTFPDSWEFKGSVSEQYKQIGNAVPVKLAFKIGRAIVACLTGESNTGLPSYISRLPRKAFVKVISSAYSNSPPIGKPWAMRVAFTPKGDRSLAKYIAVASPSTLELVATTTS